MELQEHISRGRFTFSRAPQRLQVFTCVNGKLSAKAIARKAKRSLSNTLRDLQTLRDMGLIDQRRDKSGSILKADGSVVYEKVPLARQIPVSYFTDSSKPSMRPGKPASKQALTRSTRARPLAFPNETETLDICRRGEDQIHEFKAPGVEINKITREIAAFLHTRDGGVILFGVDDDGTIVGAGTSRQKFDQSIQNSVRNTVSPSATVAVRSVTVLGTEIIVIGIPPWNRKDVYYFEHRALVRRGTNVFMAKPEEIKRLHRGEYIT